MFFHLSLELSWCRVTFLKGDLQFSKFLKNKTCIGLCKLKCTEKRFIPFSPLHFLPEFVPHTECKGRPRYQVECTLPYSSWKLCGYQPSSPLYSINPLRSHLMDGCKVNGAALEAGAEAQVPLYPAATAGPASLTSQPVQPHNSCTSYKKYLTV